MNSVELINSIVNTTVLIVLCIALAVPVGAFLSIVLHRTNVWGRRWAWIALGSQISIPLYVFAGGWSAGFGLQGWLRSNNSTLWGLHLFGTAVDTAAGTVLAVAAIHAFAAVPWVCLIVSLGLSWTNRTQEDAALLDGGLRQLLKAVVLPKLRIWLAASCLWCAVPVLTEMVVTNLYQLPTVAEQIYLDASRGSVSSSTYLSPMLLCMLPIILFGELIRRRNPRWREVAATLNHFRGLDMKLGKFRAVTSGLAWSIVLLLVGLPIINLIIKAGWLPYVDAAGVTHYGWSASRLGTTVYESLTLYSSEFYWTLLLATGATAVAVSLTATCLLWARGAGGQTAVSVCALILMSVPGPLVGMLTISLMNRNQPVWLGTLYDTTLAAPIFAQQFRLFPLAWLLGLTIMASISSRIWEQAKVDGLRGLPLFLRVVLPQTWAKWLNAALLLFVLSIGELSCTILVLPPGVTTVSMRLFEMLHFGMRHQDSGLCGVLIVFGWLVSLFSWKTLSER